MPPGPRDEHGFRRISLRRRLFKWFGASITGSVVIVVVLLQILGGTPSWKRDLELIRHFGENRFAEVWSDRAQLRRVADSFVKDLDVSVRIVDSLGREIYNGGKPCKQQAVDLTIHDGHEQLGTVAICRIRPWWRVSGVWRFAVVLVVLLAVLWAAAGRIARRLVQPLADLARVAEALGRGRWQQRFLTRRRDAEEVRILADSLNEMAARLEKQLSDQRALLAAVSHELRSPLGRMRLLIELLTSQHPGEKHLAQLDEEVKMVDHLVGDLLASARTDFSALAPKPLDARQLALRALERLEIDPTLLEVVAADPTFVGDATLIERAVHNLLTNAQRHGGGATQLRIRDEGDRLYFEVEDRGPGIGAGEEQRIFEPFYRARSPEHASESSSVGLGLSLVRRIAEAHEGGVLAERRDGGGSRIGFWVARTGDDQNASRQTQTRSTP